MDLTHAARDGYEGGDSPFILTSPADMAWRSGGWCYHNRMGAPIKASSGRGYTINIVTIKGSVTLNFKTNSRVPVASKLSAIA